jgi:hypothetical protein
MAAEKSTMDTPEKRVWLKNLYLISRILVIIAIIGDINRICGSIPDYIIFRSRRHGIRRSSKISLG